MAFQENPIPEEILDLDPRKYQIKPANIEGGDFDKARLKVFSQFQKMGKWLSSMSGLPLQEEPPESGNLVTSGNFSVRHENGGFFITGTGVNKEKPKPEGILYVEDVNYQTGEIFTAGEARHSRETLIHDLIYRTFPDVNAVIHTHDQIALWYDEAPTTANPIFFANVRQSQEVVELIKQSPYVHLRTHGQFVRGESVNQALWLSFSHHVKAIRNWLIRQMIKLAPDLVGATAVVGILSLPVAAAVAVDKKFADCEKIDNGDSMTYICPTKRDCGELKEWEGESGGEIEDGRWQCTYSTLVGTS